MSVTKKIKESFWFAKDCIQRGLCYTIPLCGYKLMVDCHASDLKVRVRFPLPAPQRSI